MGLLNADKKGNSFFQFLFSKFLNTANVYEAIEGFYVYFGYRYYITPYSCWNEILYACYSHVVNALLNGSSS